LGPRWSTLGGAIFSSLGYALLYTTTLQQQFYHTKAWLQCIYFFIAGLYISLSCPLHSIFVYQ
jgi:hypothetical protein